MKKEKKYKPSCNGGIRATPAKQHQLQNQKWLPRGPKMAASIWEVIGRQGAIFFLASHEPQ